MRISSRIAYISQSACGFVSAPDRGMRFSLPLFPRVMLSLFLIAATASAMPEISRSDDSLSISIQGEIVRECSIGDLASSIDFGDIRAAGQKAINFTVRCNTPFSYRATSENGGLQHSSGPSAPKGFLAVVPYRVAIYIPTDGTTINDACDSTAIKVGSVTCAFTDSGRGASLNYDGLSNLTLTWSPAATPLAGRYSDSLTLTVTAIP